MEEALRALLLASSSVTAITAGRINWGAHPQGVQGPRLLLTLISDVGGHDLQGPDGLSEMRVQFDCDAEVYADAKALGRAVRVLLDGYRLGSFRGVFHAGTRDDREGGTNEADLPFRVSLDFIINWRST
jgi:hypothetical protein